MEDLDIQIVHYTNKVILIDDITNNLLTDMTTFYQISTEDMDGGMLQICGMQQIKKTTPNVIHWSEEVRT